MSQNPCHKSMPEKQIAVDGRALAGIGRDDRCWVEAKNPRIAELVIRRPLLQRRSSRMNFSDLIVRHGDWIYALAFVWAFFEGETFVLFGGLAAAQGVLDPLILFASVTIGSFCGDQCWFQL